MEILDNEQVRIAVKEHGAELSSLVCGGREYLWQADEAFWKRHSPVLFPIVGSVWGGEFRAKDQTFKMGQHGFARDMDFTLVGKSSDEIRFRLESSVETLARFPYEFRLEIGYRLIGKRVRVLWQVDNIGQEPLPFHIGAHPAFFWPMLSDEVIAKGVSEMEGPLAATDSRGYFKLESKSKLLPISVITEGGCIGESSTIELDEEGYLPLDIHTFDRDALIFEDSQVSKVTLCDESRRPYLSLEFTSPLVGLWSPPRKRAPFVCIEPWYGRADSVGYNGDFASRKWGQTLAKGEIWQASYDIIVE